MTLTVAQGAKQMSEIAKVLQAAEAKAVKRAALEAKRIQLEQLKAAAPGLVLRVGKSRKTKIGVGFRMTTHDGHPAAVMEARGPVHLVERSTKPHSIPRVAGQSVAFSAGGRRRAKAGVQRSTVGKRLSINGQVRTGPVHHPGTKGKHPWEKGADEVQAKVHVDVFREVVADVSKVLR